MRRVLIAICLAVPGLIIALVAKPLLLGEAVMFSGLLLAFIAPIAWLTATGD